MAHLDTPSRLTPRSAIHYRPHVDDAGADTDGAERVPITPIVKRASRLRAPDPAEEVKAWKRAADDPVPSAPAQKAGQRGSTKRHQPRKGLQIHPLLCLGMGVGMLAMIAGLALVIVVVGWVSTTLDDIHYGRPRTFQIEAYVGHHEAPGMPSHFIALNLHGRLEVIELPAGDPTRARIYLGPQLYGTNADLVPVTLSFQDVNGDHRPDMILHFQGTQVVFINDGSGFRPAQPGAQGKIPTSKP